MKVREKAAVKEQTELSANVYSLVLRVSFAGEVKPGQFVSVFLNDRSRLLPRPISVCEAEPLAGTIRLVYRVTGAKTGTASLACLAAGDTVWVLGPLGNGFPLAMAEGKRMLLVGGGIGVPPMLACCEGFLSLPEKKRPACITVAAGYRSLADAYLLDELRRRAAVLAASDDGTLGIHGNAVDAMQEVSADLIFACGPKPMLRAVKMFAAERNIPCFVSLEERMACGVGVCLGCVTPTVGIDAHSGVKNARVCADGPVFDAREVDLS